MNIMGMKRSLVAIAIIFGLFGLGAAAVAAAKANHHDGKQLVGDKIKKDGHYEIDKKENTPRRSKQRTERSLECTLSTPRKATFPSRSTKRTVKWHKLRLDK